jgi:hypothetical protein
MVLVLLSALIIPQIMNVASVAQRHGVDQAVKLKNAAIAEEVNHLIHVSLTEPSSANSATETLPLTDHLQNYAKIFPNTTHQEADCDETDPCMRRLNASGIKICPRSRFVRNTWNTSSKTIRTLSCRNGNHPTTIGTINCESGPTTSNLSNTSDMRIFTCVYDRDSEGLNLSVSVWSYLNLPNKFVKVQEDSL